MEVKVFRFGRIINGSLSEIEVVMDFCGFE